MQTLLLLSSGSFLDKDLSGIFDKPLKEYRLAHIINASKGQGVGSLDYMERTKNRLLNHNCEFEDIDLDGKNEEQLRDILKNFDGVLVNGGSTFYLLKSIRESGFEKVLKELLPKGFIYIGISAGTYVACPTIEMAFWTNQDKYHHYDLEDFTGMNLVPFLTTVHYTSEYEDLLREKIPLSKYEVKILTDEQAILVKDDKISLLGGDEIKLN
ncbi:MAG: Type 1 glutamine amidotransferase-like domain-containing protein [Patescibacteria group bacterium]